MLRLFTEQERSAKAFEALTRFLDVLDEAEVRAAEPPLDPLVLSFQLKLLWLSGYLPAPDELRRVWRGGAARRLFAAGRRRRLRALRGGLAAALGRGNPRDRRPARAPLADAEISKRAAREALRVITSSYEYHGGFRLRTLVDGRPRLAECRRVRSVVFAG